MKCCRCNGWGYDPDEPEAWCQRCHGTGEDPLFDNEDKLFIDITPEDGFTLSNDEDDIDDDEDEEDSWD